MSLVEGRGEAVLQSDTASAAWRDDPERRMSGGAGVRRAALMEPSLAAAGSEADRVARLSPGEREALRIYLTRSDAKELAREIGKTVHEAERRLKSARRKLAVGRSLDAALILARVEAGTTYDPTVYPPSDPFPTAPHDATSASSGEEGTATQVLPLRTRTRQENELSAVARLFWIFVGLPLGIVVVMGLLIAILRTLAPLFRSFT